MTNITVPADPETSPLQPEAGTIDFLDEVACPALESLFVPAQEGLQKLRKNFVAPSPVLTDVYEHLDQTLTELCEYIRKRDRSAALLTAHSFCAERGIEITGVTAQTCQRHMEQAQRDINACAEELMHPLKPNPALEAYLGDRNKRHELSDIKAMGRITAGFANNYATLIKAPPTHSIYPSPSGLIIVKPIYPLPQETL